MANDNQTTQVTTGKVRLSYVHLFEPTTAPGATDAKYSVSIIIPKGDIKTVDKIKRAIGAAKELGKGKWGGKIPTNLKTPLRDGDVDREDDPAYKGSWFINCTSKNKPGIVDKDLNQVLDSTEVYSGCYGRVNVNFYAFDVSGNRGIACGLNHVQKTADGEPLAGGVSVEDAFAEDLDDDDMFN